MKHLLITTAVLTSASLLVGLAANIAANPAEPSPMASRVAPSSETPIVFEADSGEKVDAFEGTFTVPENRADPDSRKLTIHYVRFPATTDAPGAPIVYLAGGPGGSGIGTARRQRFALFMALRQYGDVIAYDQRGTGRSNDMQTCTRPGLGLSAVISDEEALAGELSALAACMDEWEAAGIDISGYDTVENARDLDDLRRHLDAEKLSLWGISYGSHLGLAAMRELDGRIDRAVFASIEGLEQTVKLPARTDAYFDRLQTAMNALDPETPDIKALIARVHADFDAAPKTLDVEGKRVVYHRRDMQSMLGQAISDPQWAIFMVGVYQDLDQGDVGSLETLLARWELTSDHSFSPMSRLTDIASGTDAARRRLIDAQASRSLVGSNLNASYHYEDIQPDLVLGSDFREAVESDIPVLLLSGTLDGRTYPEAAREAMAGLTNAHHVLIENAGHNLFMTDPEIGRIIERFMAGETDLPGRISVEIPD
ncbi:alpha/beta hydrolase [uncultured Algimonas sp.]|uniref:alpha/beta fold hydrolase n=1 Tax=uncultured Algimonas sp. TaxID=1547920 RepID=UPI002639C66A|nr:alpha/beta hydrolase [uncultured Algimonas sp.]